MQLSGNTVYISSPRELLPRKNLQVIQPRVMLGDTIDPSAVATAIRSHFRSFDLVEGDSDVALAFRWRGAPAYDRLAGVRPRDRRGAAAYARGGKAPVRGPGRRCRPDAGRAPQGRTGRRLRGAGDRRHLALGLRLHRSRPRAHAVLHGPGDDQVARLQRGSARPARARHHHDHGHAHHHHHHARWASSARGRPPPVRRERHADRGDPRGGERSAAGAEGRLRLEVARHRRVRRLHGLHRRHPARLPAVAELPHAADGGDRRRLHARQLHRGLRQQRHLAAVLELDPVRVRHRRSSPSCSARRSRG